MISEVGTLDIDYRIGNVPQYFLNFGRRRLVQIPDTIRKCVAFITYESAGKSHFAGTVFFVGLPDSEGNWNYSHVYAVTAKHVIDAVRERASQDHCYLRLNSLKALPNGKMINEVFIEHKDWFFHPTDSSVDVAVAPVGLPGADHLAYPIKAFATEEIIGKMGVGIGDDVFIAGLFPQHSGNKRNVPIVRAGNIAAMPEEQINSQFSRNMIGYLVEVRSFGGLSGSPVFVHLGLVRLRNDKPEGPWHFTNINAIHYLLGLVHGHWNMSIPDTDEVELDETVRQAMNTGIAIVVPAEKILEVINQPELVRMREQWEAIWRKEQAAVMDTTMEDEEKERPFTKQDFEDALKKASRIEKPEEEKGE